jgi:virginiamycin A acetyltransferase
MRMNESRLGRFIARHYPRLPARERLLRLVAKREGGQLTSMTLRRVLQEQYGVVVGAYSYGSLLQPGMADRFTTIGAYVSIGPNVRRFGAAHPIDSLSLHPYWYNPKLGFADAESDVPRTACVIGNDVWIGANVTILPGCDRVGDGAVIGAGAVVTRPVEDFTIVAGNPARVIGERLSEDERNELRARAPWSLEPAEARRVFEEIGKSEGAR